LSVAERAAEIRKIAEGLKPVTNPNMSSDLTTALALANAALEGSLANVTINLDSLAQEPAGDATFIARTRARAEALKGA
jgi:formiminotetrahydrofolate cyclodeaminase